jgi:hypothetical protein
MATAAQSNAILKRQLETREKLWPGVTNAQLWYRKERDGFATMPRLMPQIMDIMDDLAGTGTPVGQTYLEMWCRIRDENFLVLNKHEEMAFCAGFSGQRAVRTWRERVKKLAELGFIDVKPGPTGELSYALIWNPYHVLKKHQKAGRVQHAKWITLEVRATEVRATDLDDDIRAAAAAKAEAAAAAAAAIATAAPASSSPAPVTSPAGAAATDEIVL